MPFRFAILSAVSTKNQAAADKTSLADQVAICRRVIERGWRETAGPYLVRGQSRTVYVNLRDAEMEIPAIHDLLEGARRRDYDVLVVYDHDRLRDLLSLVYASLCDYGVQLYSVSAQNEPVPPDRYDPYENDTNELMIGISSIRSKAENARMRRKYRVGMRNRILVHHLPVQIPYGYARPQNEQYNRKAVPVLIPSIGFHLLAIKDLFLKGQSVSQLKAYLEENSIPPPRGNVWHPQTIRDILRNPFYAGYVQFEKSKVKKDRRFNRKSRDRHIPPDKIITSTGVHAPLWDDATLAAILAELKRRTRNFRGRQNNQFTGILHCGHCDASMWRFKNGPRAVPERMIWRCADDRSAHPSIPHIDLLKRVGALLVTSLKPYLEAQQKESLQVTYTRKIISELDELKSQRTRLEEAYLRKLFSIETFERRILELDQKIQLAEYESTHAELAAHQRETLLKTVMATLGAQSKHLPVWLERNDPSETNRILHLLLEKIIIHKDGGVELKYRD